MGRIPTLSERIVIEAVHLGIFEIDAAGRVWRSAKHSRRRDEHRTPQGYLQVRWMKGAIRYCAAAHRLVWQYLNGDIPPGHEINHDNGLKDDNRPANLLCGTSGENGEHAHRNGLSDQHGQRNPFAKLTDNEVAQIRLAYSKGGYTQQQLADRFGVSFQHVSRLIRGARRPKQGGPIDDIEHRYCASERDQSTGQFVGKRRAGRLLDGVEHSEFPGAPR